MPIRICDVLSEYLAGVLTLAEGQALVGGALDLLADPALPPEQSFEEARLAAHQAEARAGLLADSEAQAAHAARQLAVDRLDLYLQRHFKK